MLIEVRVQNTDNENDLSITRQKGMYTFGRYQ